MPPKHSIGYAQEMGLKPRTNMLIESILHEEDLNKRVQKTARFFALGLHPKDVGPKYDDVVEKCLHDSLQTGDYDQALQCLEKQQRSYSVRLESRFLDIAVVVFLCTNRKKDALNWIVRVANSSGTSAVEHIRTDAQFNAIHSSKRFQKLFDPDAKLFRFRTELKESIDMWKNDEYDNFKDAIFDCQSLLEDAQLLDHSHIGKAQKHHDEILKEARQLMEDDPVSREYLDGLVPSA